MSSTNMPSGEQGNVVAGKPSSRMIGFVKGAGVTAVVLANGLAFMGTMAMKGEGFEAEHCRQEECMAMMKRSLPLEKGASLTLSQHSVEVRPNTSGALTYYVTYTHTGSKQSLGNVTAGDLLRLERDLQTHLTQQDVSVTTNTSVTPEIPTAESQE